MTLRLRNVQIDVPADVYGEAVAFWAALLGASATHVTPSGTFTHLIDPASPVGVHLQRLEDGPAGYHLDLEARDPGREVERLLGLGATELGYASEVHLLRDPAGLRFCVTRWGSVVERLRPRRGDDPGLEFVIIDVPTAQHPAAVAFWAGAIGAAHHPVAPPNEAFRYLTGFELPGGPGNLLVQDTGRDGPTRLHLDLHVDTHAGRDAVVAHAVRLGARPIAAVQHWVTLEAPGGHLLCVVPDHRDDEDEL